MKAFYHLLINSLIFNVAVTYVWFALTYWAYLETKSVITTGVMGGIFLVLTAMSSIWFGAIVDHNKKKKAIQMSALGTLILFIIGLLFYQFTPEIEFRAVESWQLWVLVVLLLGGAILGNIRNIAIPTATTILVAEEHRDKANGLSGTVFGLSFAISSVISGLLLGFAGMFWVILSAIILIGLAVLHLSFIEIPEKHIVHVDEHGQDLRKIDLRGTIKVIRGIPGLMALIFFSAFNNFLGGVFMALMDAYGLSLMTVQQWGILWGVLSFGFILGGIIITKKGLGKNPVVNLFRVNIILWLISIFFAIQASIPLLAIGMLLYMALLPFVEAIEQTVIQKVVPPERQGRVFGFAQSVEQAASPLTAFLIGPIAQIFFIPFMTTGPGVELIGSWFGTGQGRGIALVFVLTGIIGLIVTILSMRLKAYTLLSERYQKH